MAASLVVATAGPSTAATPVVRPPVIDGDWADPELVQDRASNRWYSYATNFSIYGVAFNVPTFSSPDLVDWSTFSGDAMPELPAWASPGRTWAPGVARIGTAWVLFFTAHHTDSGRQCIGVATASAPAGPFRPSGSTPLICQTNLGGSIDASPFRDPATGSWWLHWKSDENAPGIDPAVPRLWAARLSASGTSLASTPTEILRLSAPIDEPAIESPDMVAVGSTYWLFYAAGDYRTAEYHGHVARCNGPAGPCSPHGNPSDPFLGAGSGVVGPGAASLADLGDGRWAMVFHGWRGEVGYDRGGYRATYLEPVTFDGARGAPRVRTDLPRSWRPSPPISVDAGTGVSVAGGNGLVESWRGPAGDVLVRTGVGTPRSLGGATAVRPDVATSPELGTIVAARGSDDATWVWTSQLGWRTLGGSTAHSPAIVSWGDQRIDVAVTGTDQAVWHRWSADGGRTWAPWTTLGGVLTSAPDLASWGPDRLDVVGRGVDGAVWQRAWAPGWIGWSSLGGVTQGAPAVASPRVGMLDVVVRGADDQLWTKRWLPGWSSWAALGGTTYREPGVGGDDGALTITVIGSDNRFWRKERAIPTASYGPWVPI